MRDHSRHASYSVDRMVIPPTIPKIGIAVAFARADSKIMKVSRWPVSVHSGAAWITSIKPSARCAPTLAQRDHGRHPRCQATAQ